MEVILVIGKKLDENKILFILVCKDKVEAERQLALISKVNLMVPGGCQLLLHVVIGQKNLAASFNDIQKKNNARYKIYMTAPAVFFKNDILVKLIEAFYLEPKTGFVGLIGSEMRTVWSSYPPSFYNLSTFIREYPDCFTSS